MKSALGTEFNLVQNHKKKKFNESQITIIKNVLETHKTSKKNMIIFLLTNHNIDISLSTINKIMKNQY